jgi:hypothetical protein
MDTNTYKGRIVDVRTGRGGFQRIISGIKKDEQPYYDGQFGSNGTYLGADYTYPAIFAKVCIYNYCDDGSNMTFDIDVRERVFKFYGWGKISNQRLSILQNKLTGKKVKVLFREKDLIIENLEAML